MVCEHSLADRLDHGPEFPFPSSSAAVKRAYRPIPNSSRSAIPRSARLLIAIGIHDRDHLRMIIFMLRDPHQLSQAPSRHVGPWPSVAPIPPAFNHRHSDSFRVSIPDSWPFGCS